MIKVIVSLTSHTQERLKNVGKYLYKSIFRYKYNYVHVVLTLYKEDVKFIPSDLQIMIDNNLVELIVADENLGPHLKYFYVMKKYRNLPIITIDDDSIYPEYLIPLYLEVHKKYPNCIICRSGKILVYNNGKILPFSKWPACLNITKPSHIIHAEGFAGILYPPNCLNINDSLISEIKKTFRADDIYLNILEIRNKIKILYLKNYARQLILSTKGFNALSTKTDCMKISDEYISLFRSDFESNIFKIV